MAPSTISTKSTLGGIEGHDELEQVPQRAETIGTDGEGHCPEGADRSDPHDDADDAEEDLAGIVDGAGDAGTDSAEAGYGKAGEDSDQQDLKEVALGEGVHEGIRDDRHEMRDDAFLLGAADIAGHVLGVERRDIDIESAARLNDSADEEADGQRDGRDDLEIEQRLDADAADFLEIAHRGDAVHDGAEDHRCDHHLDERDESIAERLHRLPGARIPVTEHDADGNRDKHLHVENGVPRAPLAHVPSAHEVHEEHLNRVRHLLSRHNTPRCKLEIWAERQPFWRGWTPSAPPITFLYEMRRPARPPRGDSMDALWTFLKGRALYVSVAHDAFSFDISWLGVVLLIGAALLIRHLRR
jgi:hypothetical protein